MGNQNVTPTVPKTTGDPVPVIDRTPVNIAAILAKDTSQWTQKDMAEILRAIIRTILNI